MSNKLRICLIIATFLAISSATVHFGDIIVLKPEVTGPNAAAIVFLNGALCEPSAYVDLFKAVQKSSKRPLWIALPKFFFDVPFLPDNTINYAIDALKSEGFNANDLYLAGHSLGGITGQDYIHGNPDKWKGFILLGSYIQLKYEDPQVNFPVPVLTIGGELDGLSKATRIAVAYSQMLTNSSIEAISRYPVTLIPGGAHASWITGEIPESVKNNDLKANEEAFNTTGKLISAFIDIHTGTQEESQDGKLFLLQFIADKVDSILRPIVYALELEGSPHIKSSQGVCPWVLQNAQDDMKNLTDKFRVEVGIEELGLFGFAMSKPDVELKGLALNHNVKVYKTYSWLQPFDVSQLAYESADYIGLKFKTTEAIYKVAGLTDKPSQPTCADLNQRAYDFILSILPKTTRDRFLKRGVKYQFGEDIKKNSGFAWLPAGISYNERDNYIIVSSPKLLTALDSFIFPGMFYCKVLSPGRIAEWIYTDSLRKFDKNQL